MDRSRGAPAVWRLLGASTVLLVLAGCTQTQGTGVASPTVEVASVPSPTGSVCQSSSTAPTQTTTSGPRSSSSPAGPLSPTTRVAAVTSYDAARQVLVLFGGVSQAGALLNDTWTWNGRTWTAEEPSVRPPAREHASMAYDAATQEIVLFGGSTGNPSAPLLRDTWTWDGSNWTPRNPTQSPPGFEHRPMAYDVATCQVVLATGMIDASSGAQTSETWIWDGSDWSQAHPATSPSLLYDTSMAYDGARRRLVLFGGWTDTVPQNDTWTWDGSTWHEMTPGSSPPARFSASMAEDPARSVVLLFGGTSNNGHLSDTWVWNGATWTEVQPAASPPALWDGTMIGDPATGTVVLFGGTTGASYAGAWIWNGETWVSH
jgi:hypothetical protein